MTPQTIRFHYEKPSVCQRSLKFITRLVERLIFVFLLVSIPAAVEADWPRWDGNDPGRNMYSPARSLPDRFDPGKPKPGTDEIDLSTTKNVKWVARLGSQAYGNVVVAAGKVF